jgi:hypothetical protein
MSRKSANSVLVITGIAAVVAFFLPFIDLGGLIQASGWDLLTGDNVGLFNRLFMLALPVGGIAMIATGAMNHPNARWVGFAFGAGIYGYLGFQLVRTFLATTGIGLWVTLAAAAIAVGVALGSKRS